jgi:hypothetical protein
MVKDRKQNKELNNCCPTSKQILFPFFSFNPLIIEFHEKVEAIPKVGDLWVLMVIVSPHH